jgi:Site-specific recombinase XerD
MSSNIVLEQYKTYLENNNRSPKTIQNYLTVLGELSSYLKHKPFKEMSEADISSFLQWKRNHKAKRSGDGIKYEGTISQSSYALYVMLLKIFYRWLYKLPRHQYPDQVAELDVKIPHTQAIQPSDITTKDDVVAVLGVCQNFREKALVSCLYESACRISEFLSWQIGDIVFDSKGAVLNVRGKTGERRIRLIESVPHLQQWLQAHPRKSDRKAWVWSKGKRKLLYMTLLRLLRRLFKKAGIDKPCNPHALRHSRLTELAKYLSDAKLKVFAGWVGSSRMAGTYVHLSGADLDDDLLKAAGMPTETEIKLSPLKTQPCPRCQTSNSGEAKFCSMCGVALNPEEYIGYEMEELESMKAHLGVLMKKMEKLEKQRKKR